MGKCNWQIPSFSAVIFLLGSLLHRYRFEDMTLAALPNDRMATIPELFEHTFFWRSDHSRFWFYNDDKGFHSLGSVLITDTGKKEGREESAHNWRAWGHRHVRGTKMREHIAICTERGFIASCIHVFGAAAIKD